MSHETIIAHITACSERTNADPRSHTSRIVGDCWPGGDARTEPGALGWVARWRPAKLGAELPACSCPAPHCSVCN